MLVIYSADTSCFRFKTKNGWKSHPLFTNCKALRFKIARKMAQDLFGSSIEFEYLKAGEGWKRHRKSK